MTGADDPTPTFETKLAELDRLLNDPDVRMEPGRVWSLLDELTEGAPRH